MTGGQSVVNQMRAARVVPPEERVAPLGPRQPVTRDSANCAVGEPIWAGRCVAVSAWLLLRFAVRGAGTAAEG